MTFPTPDEVQATLESEILTPLVERLRTAVLAEFKSKVGPTYSVDVDRVLNGTDPTLAYAAVTRIKAQLAISGWAVEYENSQRGGTNIYIRRTRHPDE